MYMYTINAFIEKYLCIDDTLFVYHIIGVVRCLVTISASELVLHLSSKSFTSYECCLQEL